MQDIEDLVELKKDAFDKKEWLALNFARRWAVLRGQEPRGKAADAYEKQVSKKERAYILKICRMMKMANYTANTLFGIPWKKELSSPEDESGGALAFLAGPVEGLLSDAVLFATRRMAAA